MIKHLDLIGSAFVHGAQIHGTELGPLFLKKEYMLQNKLSGDCLWGDIVETPVEETSDEQGLNYEAVLNHSRALAKSVQEQMLQNQDAFLSVVGGDHSCGIGTWSGIITGLQMKEEFGLIWIDAHMDSHTLESSPSKAYHGMPLSHLLGEGNPLFCDIGSPGRKIKPEHLVLIGIRSFEHEEEAFLKKHDVTVFYMEDVKRLGLDAVVNKTIEKVTLGTRGFGVSIDLDAFDPTQAPGTGSIEADGILYKDFENVMPQLFGHPLLKCLEIAEFNPGLDKNNITADLIRDILEALTIARR